MSILQSLKKAKGLGSGHNGTHHFIVQRASAVILIPLVLYFLFSLIVLSDAEGFAAVQAWFANPLNSGLSLAFIITGFYHAALGLQVVIEDYIHHEQSKWLALIAVKGVCLIGALIAIVSIIRLGLAH
ncbi:succinate dehydrogenase, hydrophobic membrane anchor protein [Suttonella sp. R2A3]|uniref:succinate dehydrogenase, hydrophobic membrane anchor protein n=1 Tax=Suttonella sp. R2A3 TaxID=2908648 RepID=UPI001F4065D8|nr:succinate dehydrogenase, hydrophobic membrane anchor protein [Suttonella sp. R2A3]UJF24276.1 succinate dehydrogenase, hydrophobic membrane anchor protein [Suttonella sp. R2A3]